MCIKPARLANVNSIATGEEFKVGFRRFEDGNSEVEGDEDPVGISMSDDAISGRTVQATKAGRIDTFLC